MSDYDFETEQRIRERAYHLWQKAGCPEGQEEVFWQAAKEAEKPLADHGKLTDDASRDSFPASDAKNHM